MFPFLSGTFDAQPVFESHCRLPRFLPVLFSDMTLHLFDCAIDSVLSDQS